MAMNAKTILLSLSLVAGINLPAWSADLETVTVAGGCFWCVESDFESVRGVTEAVSGFSGGQVRNPTYKQVTSGGTGHREAVQITFDPSVISIEQIYAMFLRTIDVTDAGGQFCDRGKSYTTAIYSASSEQAAAAKAAIAKAEAELGRSVVTPIETLKSFYPAEAYHQDYYKSRDRVLTRFGLVSKAKAYKKYRTACGRDARVAELWGSSAPFARGH